MSCRQTGFAMLAESNVQEIMDLGSGGAPRRHQGPHALPQLLRRLPHLPRGPEGRPVGLRRPGRHGRHGCRQGPSATTASTPSTPTRAAHTRTTTPSSSTARHATPPTTRSPPSSSEYMDKINEKLGTDLRPLQLLRRPRRRPRHRSAMGSVCDVAEEVVDYLNAHGEKVGLVKVRLYRPFSIDHFVDVLPSDVSGRLPSWTAPRSPAPSASPCTRMSSPRSSRRGRTGITVVGGRYGLGSKDTPPSSAFAIYKEREKDDARPRVHRRHQRRRHPSLPPRGSGQPQHGGPRHHRVQVLGSGRRRHGRREQELPSRSSATTPTSTSRRTSSTTPRRPAA